MAGSDAHRVVERLLTRAEQAPLDEDAAANLANAALDSSRESEALTTVAATARRLDGNARLWQWTGLLYRALDQHEQALAAFERATRLAPTDAKIAHGHARITLEAGLPAMALFDRALLLAPADGEVRLGSIAARCAQGDAIGAIGELDALLTANPGWCPGHELAARLRWMHGLRDGFAVSIERALAVAPYDISLWRALLILLVHADRFDETLAAGRRARSLIGDHIVIAANEAAALSELGRVAEADVIYNRIAGLDDVTLAVRHIRHLLRNDRVEEAARRAEPFAHGPAGGLIWPYLSLAWRLLNDRRWAWLEGDADLVGIFDLADQLPPLEAIVDVLRGLHQSTHQPLDQSLRGGTQTDGMLFQRIEPEIRAMRAVVVEAIRQHIAQLPAFDAAHPLLGQRRDVPPRFSGSWSVRLTGAGHHANHNHPAGWLSSALYIALPATNPADEPHAGWLTLGEPQVELGLDLPATRMIEPKPGRLVLFPSTMWHGTRPFAVGERLTVAFDVAAPY